MIANLPWYDFEETYELNDQFWLFFRNLFSEIDSFPLPDKLNRKDPLLDCLLSENLFLSQTCGYDIACNFPVTLVATPIYKTQGAARGLYSSFFIKRKATNYQNLKDALSFGRFVANDDRSFSGFHCVQEISPVRPIWSGCHLKSIAMINNGQADWAAIDAITWALLEKYNPAVCRDLEIFHQGRQVPAPPLVTSNQRTPAEIFHIQKTLTQMAQHKSGKKILEGLLIENFCFISKSEYKTLIPQKEAQYHVRSF